MDDLVFEGGHVVDGTGAPWFVADVSVRDGKISGVGRLADLAVFDPKAVRIGDDEVDEGVSRRRSGSVSDSDDAAAEVVPQLVVRFHDQSAGVDDNVAVGVSREPAIDVLPLDHFERALQAPGKVVFASVLARVSERMPLPLEPPQ
jgi:N-acyl-D-aspartate/D-glutamate deacylase